MRFANLSYEITPGGCSEAVINAPTARVIIVILAAATALGDGSSTSSGSSTGTTAGSTAGSGAVNGGATVP